MGATEWYSDGVYLPKQIERAFWADELVFFCGAGVSSAKPSELPGFRGLAEQVADTLGHPELVPDDESIPVQFDVVMGKLDEISGDVHRRVSTLLQVAVTPNDYHRGLWRIAGAHGKTARIVTTNFDLLLEAAADELQIEPSVHVAPSLPLGDDFSGLVHLHGIQHPPATTRMVLTDRDFGRAYITEGWATQFLTRLFATYTVVLIGYSAEDTIIQYLNRALPSSRERFAFTKNAEDFNLWDRLGITPVPFPSTQEAPYGALESFIGSWSTRLSASASQRFDQIADLVAAGPELAMSMQQETTWKLEDPELARHFRLHARASDWLAAVDKLGVLDSLFSPNSEALANPYEWAQWVRASVDEDDGALLLDVLARHGGQLRREMWFHIWHKLYADFNGSPDHRRLVFVLASSEQPAESARLSMLVDRTVRQDPETAELLLLRMLNPELTLKVRSNYGFRSDSLETRLRLHWRSSSIRDAWGKLMPRLSDRGHFLATAMNLIRAVERTDAFFSGRERQDAISSRREQVEYPERYSQDDPYGLVVDIARDLMREAVISHGPRDALRFIEDRSEMIRRLAIDALAESRSAEADTLLKIVMQQALPFATRSRPEVFRLLAAIYKNATEPTRSAFLDYVQSAARGPDDAEVTEYAKFNVLVWLSMTADADDPVHPLQETLQREHGFEPSAVPNLSSVRGFTPMAGQSEQAEGRFRSLSVEDLIMQLRTDRSLQDEYSDGPTLRELFDYLDHAGDVHLSVLDKLITEELWSSSVWRATLQSAVRKTDWTAEDLLARIEANSLHASELASRLDFAVAHPNNELGGPLDNATERGRLLLGLWRMTSVEPGAASPTDFSEARATPRGSLAHYFIETLLRDTQQRGSEAQIDAEGITGLQELLDVQGQVPDDPSPMMIAAFASSLEVRAPDWFEEQLLPRLRNFGDVPRAATLWSGLLSRRFPSARVRERLAEQIRTGWPRIAEMLPGSIESFIQLHSICFLFDRGQPSREWPDAFLTHAPETARERWTRSVAHYLDQEGVVATAQDLLFSHWDHRLDGQPPISPAEQRALVRWLVLPGIDVARATELFVRGPVVAANDDDLYDYYDLDGFPHQDNPGDYLRVANHLMQGSVMPPPFAEQLMRTAIDVAQSDAALARRTLNTLLRLGYAPARVYLAAMTDPQKDH